MIYNIRPSSPNNRSLSPNTSKMNQSKMSSSSPMKNSSMKKMSGVKVYQKDEVEELHSFVTRNIKKAFEKRTESPIRARQ